MVTLPIFYFLFSIVIFYLGLHALSASLNPPLQPANRK